ncbi:MAG: glycine--tRNA ligase subunit beta [Desulfobulbaceae bacterium]|nr:glycine--tRNA ligase subunit beta [Desulfobulbaceae bacterium]
MGELLFEIGTEEIPAGYIKPALEYFGRAAKKHFAELGLACGEIRTLGTPRRLTLVVDDLQERQPDRVVEHIGPSAQAGFDKEGVPTRAALGFARSRGVDVHDLKVVATAKGEYLVAVEDVKGVATGELLPEILPALIREMPFPKSMRWGQGDMAFVRPIQWLLALFNGREIRFSFAETTSGATTRGHRFMGLRQPIAVNGFAQYQGQLKENWVLVDQRERREIVVAEVKKAVQEHVVKGQAEPVLDEELVATVTNLVEYPWGVCGTFDDKFLELPREVLVTSMREHQKYFPVIGRDGNLLSLFVAVNNTRIDDLTLAVSGHQRVLRARLEDALFFFREDKKRKLADRRQDLAGIVFQKKLGSMLDKSERTAVLAAELARRLDPGSEQDARRAALLAKCDLLTEIVGEFPSLQGIMGREYALLDHEKEEVASAIYEHYKPVRAGGELPEKIIGAIVGIADRADTLAGCFAIGEKPTGTTDPFGLRRLALGLLNIILAHDFHVSLREILLHALAGYREMLDIQENTIDELLDFIRLRFENDVIAGGTSPETVIAGTAVSFDDVADCRSRIRSLADIGGSEQFEVLAGSFKRIKNIIKDNRETAVQEELLSERAEKGLYETLADVRARTGKLVAERRYDEALAAMLEMKDPVDLFFDEVMVMTEDQEIRRNRLNLLTALGEIVLQVGDISRMHFAGSSA